MFKVFGWKTGVGLGVAVFIALLVWSVESEAETWIGIGGTVVNTESSVGMFEYRGDKYDAGVFVIGQGQSDGDYQDRVVPLVSFARKWDLPIHEPLSLGLGLGYTEGILVCDDFSFRLQLVYYFTPRVTLGAYHFSNAGISRDENTGLDLVALGIRF